MMSSILRKILDKAAQFLFILQLRKVLIVNDGVQENSTKGQKDAGRIDHQVSKLRNHQAPPPPPPENPPPPHMLCLTQRAGF